MPAPEQTWTLSGPTTLTPIAINGVSITGSYTPVAATPGLYDVTINTIGRLSEMKLAVQARTLTSTGAEALGRALVDIAYDMSAVLPPLP